MARINRVFAFGLFAILSALPHLDAQIHNLAELYGGVNFTSASPDPIVPKENLTGFVFGVGAYANSWFGANFQVSKQYGTVPSSNSSFASASLHESTYMAGPQFRFLNRTNIGASFRALLGGVQGQVFQPGSMESQTRFAVMLGVGVDVGVTKRVAIRVEPGLYRTSFNQQNQNNFRISFGPVFRFGTAK
jgi:opacity protein-like surface antigen